MNGHKIGTLAKSQSSRDEEVEMKKGDNDSFDPVKKSQTTKKEIQTKYMFSAKSHYTAILKAYVIQNYIKKIADDILYLEKFRYEEVEYEIGKQEVVLCHGSIIFTYHNEIFAYKLNLKDDMTIQIQSQHSVTELCKDIEREIKENNPLRGANIRLSEATGLRLMQTEKTPYEDLILDKKIKEDIYDNTVFSLEVTKTQNGIIFYGEPGTGKSLCCQSIVYEAHKRGITTIVISESISFPALEEFIESFLLPRCIVVFEDIDSFALNRESGRMNSELSSFLQMINGINNKHDGIVFIATTNYIEHIDKAISKRPVRFNRKYNFDLPDEDSLKKLIRHYFHDVELSEDSIQYCFSKKFVGAHIAEIRRTYDLMIAKEMKAENSNIDVNALFKKSVAIVHEHFSLEKRNLGFEAE